MAALISALLTTGEHEHIFVFIGHLYLFIYELLIHF